MKRQTRNEEKEKKRNAKETETKEQHKTKKRASGINKASGRGACQTFSAYYSKIKIRWPRAFIQKRQNILS